MVITLHLVLTTVGIVQVINLIENNKPINHYNICQRIIHCSGYQVPANRDSFLIPANSPRVNKVK